LISRIKIRRRKIVKKNKTYFCFLFMSQVNFWSGKALVLFSNAYSFNWQGGLWFFVSFRNLLSNNTSVRILIFFVTQSEIFFLPEINIRLYDKNSESDYFFFPPPKSEYFFLEKTHNLPPPLEVKWSVLNKNDYGVSQIGHWQKF
jgi:hypothetical protein